MSPVRSQPSSVNASSFFSGMFRYPGMTQSALIRTSPSSSNLISTPGVGGPTVPSLIRSGGLMVPSPQVSDIPQSSPIGIPIAWKNSSTSSGVGAAPALTASASSRPSCLRSWENICSSAWAAASAISAGTSSPACSSADLLERRLEALRGRLALLVRQPGEHRLEPGLELLEDPRHREEPGRVHLGQELGDPARIGADGHREPLGDRQVVVGVPLGDVCGRQPGDHLPAALGQLDHPVGRRHREEQVAVRELDPLREGRSSPRCRSASADRRVRWTPRVSAGSKSGSISISSSSVWSPPSPSTTITCSRAGSSPRASVIRSMNACSVITTLLSASESTYWICSGAEVW